MEPRTIRNVTCELFWKRLTDREREIIVLRHGDDPPSYPEIGKVWKTSQYRALQVHRDAHRNLGRMVVERVLGKTLS